jgi:ribosomal protein L19
MYVYRTVSRGGARIMGKYSEQGKAIAIKKNQKTRAAQFYYMCKLSLLNLVHYCLDGCATIPSRGQYD